jgi:hypothetical protein
VIRLLEINESPDSPVSFYRSSLPLSSLRRQVGDLQIETRPERGAPLGWSTLSAFDILFFSNPRSPRAREIIQMARTLGVKVWIDYDDLYLDLPKENPHYSTFRANHAAHHAVACLLLGDVVTVSTGYLREAYGRYHSAIRVVPNAFPLELLAEPALGPIRRGVHNFVSWRGAEQHRRNLREFAEPLTAVARSVENRWAFKFFGCNPECFDGLFPYTHYEFDEMIRALYRMKSFGSKVHIVTMYDGPYNRAKSNIAWIEATVSGSVVLAPDWEEWQRPGILNYGNKEDFRRKLQELLDGDYDIERHFEESRDYLLAHLSLTGVNRQRMAVLQQLSGAAA